MIFIDALSTSNSHIASTSDLASVQQLDRSGGIHTSLCLSQISVWMHSASTSQALYQASEPAGKHLGTATLPTVTSERLQELSRLAPDWDSYGALRPSNRAIAAAGTLVSRIIARIGSTGAPHEIMPIADGGVSLEWRAHGTELSLNAYPDDGWSYLLIAPDEHGRHSREEYDLSDDDVLILAFKALESILS